MGKNKHNPAVGIPSIDTRTIAGTIGKKLLFCLPGSPGAVTLGIQEIINRSIHTLIGQIDKSE
jgi:molybdenum cofactor biosynthesis protein B